MADDKIVSFKKALEARERANVDAHEEAELKASGDLEHMLIAAVKAWLEKPKSADETHLDEDDWAHAAFYGGVYFIQFWATLVDDMDLNAGDSDMRAFAKKLQELTSEWTGG